MLKLKKLQMLGFKSFCDRTELQFSGAGVVGIVGPNGCGKSNIADAIGWVLGEQSAKSLRGGRMEDVIFAGTRDRPATGMAEVSLTLVDPAEYELQPVEAAEPEADAELETSGWGDEEETEAHTEPDAAATPETATGSGVVLTIRKRRKFRAHNRRGEVVVTRRLFRNGESEYLMNGRLCRLRDIQDLFLGTGLGPESYAIIEQGRIGQILSTKPYDRRAIIEEAAGVSKYKVKRRLAEARLESARQNLARINDIFEEVSRQVGSLKRQAGKAQRYRQLKAELDTRQRLWLRARAQAQEAAEIQLREQQAAAQSAVDAAQAEIAALETARSAAQSACALLEREVRHAADEAARLERERDAAGQQAAFERQQAEELTQRGAGNRLELEQADRQSDAMAAELDHAGRDRDAAGQRLAAAQAALEGCLREHAAAQAALEALERDIAARRQQALELLARAAQLGNQIAQGEAALAALDRQLERLQREEAAARAEIEAGGVRRGQLALEFQDQEGEALRLAAQLEALEFRAADLTAAEAGEREAAQAARTQAAEVGARRRSLEEIAGHHGYSSEAVKRLFAGRNPGAGFDPLGVLGEFVEVEAPYDHVVEQFLQEELNYVVVRSWEQAGAGVGLLRAQEQGRATFLVHGDASAGTPRAAAPEPPANGHGHAGAKTVPLLGEVRALNGFQQGLGEILPKLRDAYWLEDAAAAPDLAAQHPRAYFLTPQGECFHNSTVSGGAGRSSGPLSLKRELRELARREADVQAAIARHERQSADLAVQLQAAQRELDAARARRQETERRLWTGGQAARQVEQELERAQALLQLAQVEGARARAEQAQWREQLEQAGAERSAVEAERERLRALQAEDETRAAAVRSASHDAAQALTAAQTEQARVEERARAAEAGAERLQRLLAELRARREHLRNEGSALETRRLRLLESCAAGEHRRQELAATLAAAAQRLAEREAGLAAAQARGEEQEATLRAARAQLDLRRQACNQGEVALARLEADGAHLRQTCRDELGCELETLLLAAAADALVEASVAAPAAGGSAARADDAAALEATVRELRQRIENLGPVNMMALEEFEEAQQRHTFMQAQRQDLLDSIADTHKAIQEMDAISRQKFQEAFERINEYFQETFRILFGGGQGFLRLSEIEGSADGGVDLVAQPPGKKLQNALLLSGGEKAMTAMALLLAIFRFQPSPFCLLDEVDAPMDEANVVRFCDMVEKMGANTQFILITHNRRTMESAPTLYGVTMPHAGVSRLVSVMVEEAQRQAAS